MKNIAYQTDQLALYFSQNRVTWAQFYDSERLVIERLGLGPRHRILDIGCGCGGLGLALRERFDVREYTGVEINRQAAEAARRLNPQAHILCGDMLDLSASELRGAFFDAVFSLSCVDWNVAFSETLAAAWKHVAPGGHLVSTFRLTAEDGCNDIERSYQYINVEGKMEGERASYVVLNVGDLMNELRGFDPLAVHAYGYWGEPSRTAVTPYKKLCFAAFSVRKRRPGEVGRTSHRLDLPAEILNAAGVPAVH